MIASYQQAFLAYLEESLTERVPSTLYEPVNYILGLGGKRIRPVLALLAADAVGDEYKSALPVALAVEMFHNFTLLHDDIMDNSPLRRGQETVHIKWDDATAILSGDLLQIEVYEKLAEVGNVEIL